MILVDTNVLSEVRKPDGEAKVKQRLAAFRDDVFVSAIVLGEIAYGVQRMPHGKKRVALAGFLALTKDVYADRILDVTRQVGERWGLLRAQCQAQGHEISFADGLIAATALEHDLTLMTRNTRDFELTGVRLLNPWED